MIWRFIEGTENEADYQTKKHTCKAPKGSWSHKGSYGIHETQDERRGFIYSSTQYGNEENREMSIKKGGHTFEGLNKPIKTPNHKSGKAGAVVVKVAGKEKLIRFGMQGASTKPPRKGESEADKAKRRSFKARHAKNIARGKVSAAYWADKTRW